MRNKTHFLFKFFISACRNKNAFSATMNAMHALACIIHCYTLVDFSKRSSETKKRRGNISESASRKVKRENCNIALTSLRFYFTLLKSLTCFVSWKKKLKNFAEKWRENRVSRYSVLKFHFCMLHYRPC